MPRNLEDLELDEVSFVDTPANPGARIMLAKKKEEGKGGGDKGDDEDEKERQHKQTRGIKFVIGFKESGGSEVQSVLFDADVWDEERARSWLKSHDMKSDKVDRPESGGSLRFRQRDPSSFIRFRTITPGEQVGKALRVGTSWNRLQQEINAEVERKFGSDDKRSWLYTKDFWKDNVVIERSDGSLFRVTYDIAADGGQFSVSLGEPIPVEQVYLDKDRSEPERVSPEMMMRLGNLDAQVSMVAVQACALDS